MSRRSLEFPYPLDEGLARLVRETDALIGSVASRAIVELEKLPLTPSRRLQPDYKRLDTGKHIKHRIAAKKVGQPPGNTKPKPLDGYKDDVVATGVRIEKPVTHLRLVAGFMVNLPDILEREQRLVLDIGISLSPGSLSSLANSPGITTRGEITTFERPYNRKTGDDDIAAVYSNRLAVAGLVTHGVKELHGEELQGMDLDLSATEGLFDIWSQNYPNVPKPKEGQPYWTAASILRDCTA